MLKHIKMLLLAITIGMFAFTTNVFAESTNKVTLNFDGGIVHDGYVEYSGVGKLQLFKDDELVTNISSGMEVDLDEASYQFVIDDSSSTDATPTRIIINDWYYSLNEVNSKKVFKLDTSKFYSGLNIKLEKKQSAINTKRKVEMAKYDINETIDLSKEYVIDFSKTDDLTHVLKLFADLDKTLYYKLADDSDLEETTNVDEAIIKIVGNKSENKAVISAVNVGNKKEEKIKGLRVKYHYTTVEKSGDDNGILNITEHLHYSTNEYEFIFKYLKEEVEQKEYKVIEGANQTYTKNKSEDVTFKIDADYNLFENGGKVYIDNVLVDGKNYTSKSGSTIITLNKEYVDTLSIGKHTIKFVFNDGRETTTEFEIKEKETNNGNLEKVTNPQTGDSITTHFILSIVSVLGIITFVMINNKKKIKY